MSDLDNHSPLNESQPAKRSMSVYVIGLLCFLLGLAVAVLVAMYLTAGNAPKSSQIDMERTQVPDDLSTINDPLYGVPGEDAVTQVQPVPSEVDPLTPDPVNGGATEGIGDGTASAPQSELANDNAVNDGAGVDPDLFRDVTPDMVPDAPVEKVITTPPPTIRPKPEVIKPKPKPKAEVKPETKPATTTNTSKEDDLIGDIAKQQVKPKPKVEVKPKLEAKPKSEDKPEAAKSAKKFYVQAGSFKNRDEAESRKAELALSGVESRISQTNVNGVTVNRVQIGPFNDGKGLREANQNLKDKGYDAVVVPQN